MTITVKRARQQPRPDDPIDSENRLSMMAGASYTPKNNQSNDFQDAHFIFHHYHTLGLAYGTPSWSNKDIDAGEFARELMSNALISISHNYREGQNVDPVLVLNQAFLKSKPQDSSTALILSLKNCSNGSYLHAANVGDSGFLLIRGGKIVYESQVLKSKFSCPCHLGKSCIRSPWSPVEIMVPVQCGDIVVAAADGLFDNVYGYEIEILVQLFMEDLEFGGPEILADNIAQYALGRAKDDSYFSPFKRAAQQAGFHHVSGKYHDITVIVAYIGPAD